MMQTPVGALTLDKSRAEFLNWLGQGLPNGQAPITIDNKTISGAVSEQLSNLADEPVTVDSALALRSRDDVCVYMGGTATTTIGDTAVTQSVSGCASVAGRRPFNLFAYSNSKNPSGYKALQPMLRRWALSIRQIK